MVIARPDTLLRRRLNFNSVAFRLTCSRLPGLLGGFREINGVAYQLLFCTPSWWCYGTDDLSELISSLYAPTRTLRSANTGLLALPAGATSHFSSRSFSASSPSVWNSLPAHVRYIDNLSTFKRHLKSHLFQSAFTA